MRVRRVLPLLALALPLLVAPTAHAAEECVDGAVTDFNGDGQTDVVVGDSTATVDGVTRAGVVQVRYGSGGLVGNGTVQTLRQQEAGDGLPPQPHARYGFSLATADIDCDGYTDVLASAPYYDVSGRADSGAVQLLWGGPGGVASGGTNVYTASQFGKTPVAGDQFGYAVDLMEDVEQGGTPPPDAYALAIGVPGRDSAGKADSGAVATRSAIDGNSDYLWTDQESPGVPGSSVKGDRFGHAVAWGYLDGGSDVDLVVGVPGKDVSGKSDAGQIVLLRGVYGFEIAGATAYHQNSSGVPGSAEKGDQFGKVIDVVHRGEGVTQGVIGIPNEDGSKGDSGSVQLFSNGSSGITWGAGISQDTSGVGGAGEYGDQFGADVALSPTSPVRLAVGVPGEDTAQVDAGIVQLFRLDDVAADVSYGQDVAGVYGDVERGDKFGTTVAFARSASELQILVGVPHDVAVPKGLVSYVPVTGSHRTWLGGYAGSATFGDAIGATGH